jgi:hypothetical protein
MGVIIIICMVTSPFVFLKKEPEISRWFLKKNDKFGYTISPGNCTAAV